MKRINVNLYPKDGYWFHEKDGSRHRAATWAGVMRKVEDYRRRTGYPLGNIEAEVSAQACSRNPAHCTDENDATIQQRKVVSLKSRVLQWMGALRRIQRQIVFVSAQEAAERANICASCPFNTGLPEGCATCRAALRAMRFEIIGPSRAQDARLNGCLLTGRDLPTDVHIDSERKELPEAPANCWRKRGV